MTVNFILYFAELHSGNSIRYKITLFEKCNLKCYKVKRISISFNCFSEYIMVLSDQAKSGLESAWCVD